MAIRIPRGFDPDTKPAYNELSEGVRPTISNYAIAPASSLPIFDMDELSNDPIILPAGTILGIQWDNSNTPGAVTADVGTFVPAVLDLSVTPNTSGNALVAVGSTHTADETTFGMTITGYQVPVYPIGVCFKPIYAFNPGGYENYKREHAVSFVTDYLIQVPARTEQEHDIRPGDTLVVSNGKGSASPAVPQWNKDQTTATWTNGSVGTFMAADDAVVALGVTGGLGNYTGNNAHVSTALARQSHLSNYLVGKCMAVTLLGSSSAATAGESLVTALTNETFTINSSANQGHLRADREFHALDKLQTVPGHRVTGSGTKGVPGFAAGTFGARSDSSGNFRLLTILLRIV